MQRAPFTTCLSTAAVTRRRGGRRFPIRRSRIARGTHTGAQWRSMWFYVRKNPPVLTWDDGLPGHDAVYFVLRTIILRPNCTVSHHRRPCPVSGWSSVTVLSEQPTYCSNLTHCTFGVSLRPAQRSVLTQRPSAAAHDALLPIAVARSQYVFCRPVMAKYIQLHSGTALLAFFRCLLLFFNNNSKRWSRGTCVGVRASVQSGEKCCDT